MKLDSHSFDTRRTFFFSLPLLATSFEAGSFFFFSGLQGFAAFCFSPPPPGVSFFQTSFFFLPLCRLLPRYFSFPCRSSPSLFPPFWADLVGFSSLFLEAGLLRLQQFFPIEDAHLFPSSPRACAFPPFFHDLFSHALSFRNSLSSFPSPPIFMRSPFLFFLPWRNPLLPPFSWKISHVPSPFFFPCLHKESV